MKNWSIRPSLFPLCSWLWWICFSLITSFFWLERHILHHSSQLLFANWDPFSSFLFLLSLDAFSSQVSLWAVINTRVVSFSLQVGDLLEYIKYRLKYSRVPLKMLPVGQEAL